MCRRTRASAVDTAAALATGTPYHVVSTWDSATGLLQAVSERRAGGAPLTRTGTPVNTNNRIYVGKDDREGNTLTYRMDEPAMFNRPLSAAEVLQHYLAGASSVGSTTTINTGGGNVTINGAVNGQREPVRDRGRRRRELQRGGRRRRSAGHADHRQRRDVTFASTLTTTGNVTQSAGTGSTTFSSGGTIGGALSVTTGDQVTVNGTLSAVGITGTAATFQLNSPTINTNGGNLTLNGNVRSGLRPADRQRRPAGLLAAGRDQHGRHGRESGHRRGRGQRGLHRRRAGESDPR